MAKSLRGRVPAAAPFAYFPPLVDPDAAEAALDATLDLAPWAAYMLGYHVGGVFLNLRLARTVPQFGADGYNAVPTCASAIRLACDLLAATASAEAVTQMRHAVNELEAFNNCAAHDFYRSGRFVWDAAVANELARRLPILMPSVLPCDSPLHPWLSLGHAVGDFLAKDPVAKNVPLARHRRTPAPEDWIPVPFRPVVDAARQLPRAERDALRELAELAALIDRPESGDEPGLRRLYVTRLAVDWFMDELDPVSDGSFFAAEIGHLHRQIGEYLITRVAAPPPQRDAGHVPLWDRGTGMLMFEGEVVRTVVERAVTVREILDLFQSQHWPQRTETDYSCDAKKSVVNSLNSNLTVIEFHRSGTACGIGWRRRVPQ